ncbi:MAG: mycofactocin biosynthesis peptidyl-dipeptidase MftE, partial [Microthrixaceae bacterium]
RWPDLEAVDPPLLLVVPVGSCEQHGPHLPLDTDTRIACALADALAAGRQDAAVAPAITIGASGEHAGFAGTLSIGTAVLTEVLVELARSALPPPGVAPGPFGAVLFVNGHGGNVEALAAAAALLLSESRNVATWHPRVPDGDPHAGHTETSLMLHLHPDEVAMDLAEPGSTARFPEILDDLHSGGLAGVSPNGVLGDPRTANGAHGAEIFEALLSDLVEVAGETLPSR